SVAPSLLDGMQNLSSETGAAGAPGERVSRLRGGSTAPGVGGSCPPTTNRGAFTRINPDSQPSTPDEPSRVGSATRAGAEFGGLANVEYYGGYDGGCEIGYYGKWVEDPETGVSFANDLEPRLAALKEQATKCEGEAVATIDLAGVKFVVGPRGSGGKGVSYNYILKGSGVTLLVHKTPTAKIQPVRVHFGFSALHGRRFFAVVERVEKLLADIGFEIERSVISRVDLQVTMTVDPQILFAAIRNGQSVASARGRKWEEKGGRVETFTAGSNTQICIYDKLQELLDKQDAEKTAAVSSMFPNGYFHLTRVEYRLRRKALKMMEIHSLQDLKEKEADLIDDLTTRWFRILNCRPSKGNETRYKAHPVWKLVTYAFKTVFDEQNDVDEGDKKERGRRDPNIVRCEPEELVSQAVGVLASWISKKFGYQKDIKKVWRYVTELLELHLPQIFKKANYRARKTELEKGVYVESSDSLAELAETSGGFGFDDCGGGRSSVLDWLNGAVVSNPTKRLPSLTPPVPSPVPF
ncbi:MAG: hypothetical protein IJY15_10920, partial [Thermoguttaceae bacterium]|nr:hypothetical protein [Thermoguttaceae bacterium]